jgi:hypothetical protein
LAQRSNVDYEKSFVAETIGAIHAWQVSCSTDRGSGTYREMTAEKVATINGLYHSAAVNMYAGLANQMAQSSLSPLWNTVLARMPTSEVLKVDTTAGSAHFAASSTDLANRGQSTLATITGSASKYGGTMNVLNDGQMNDSGTDLGSTANAYVPAEGDQLTITFDISANRHGYDISQLVSYSACNVDRIAQSYDVDVLQVGSTEWLPIFSGYDMGRDVQAVFAQDSWGRELKNTIQDSTGALLAANVWQVRFTFHDTNGFGPGGAAETVYREFDVLGAASVPEPSSLTLAILGLALSSSSYIARARTVKSETRNRVDQLDPSPRTLPHSSFRACSFVISSTLGLRHSSPPSPQETPLGPK